MARALSNFERYLRVADDTEGRKFDTLVRARDFFRAIPLLNRTGQTSRALAKLNSVVDGRYDAPVIAEAFRRLKNVDSSAPAELAEAEVVLRTIIRDDRNSGKALEARKLLHDWKLSLNQP